MLNKPHAYSLRFPGEESRLYTRAVSTSTLELGSSTSFRECGLAQQHSLRVCVVYRRCLMSPNQSTYQRGLYAL